MKITFKRFRHQNSDDVWEDTSEKRSLVHTILDLLLSPTYRLPRTVTTVRIYEDRNCFSVCPRCKKVIEYEYQSYCGSCGQHLDRSKLDVLRKSSSGGMVQKKVNRKNNYESFFCTSNQNELTQVIICSWVHGKVIIFYTRVLYHR